jgi:hypothetical protein
MRTSDEVREKLDELRARRLAKRKDENLSKCPRNCVFNRPQRVKGKGEVRLCENQEVLGALRRPCFVCSEDETARRCKKFESRKTEEQIEREFDEILGDPARCGHTYPKLAIMIWFLQDFDSSAVRQGEGGRWARLMRAVHYLICMKWW